MSRYEMEIGLEVIEGAPVVVCTVSAEYYGGFKGSYEQPPEKAGFYDFSVDAWDDVLYTPKHGEQMVREYLHEILMEKYGDELHELFSDYYFGED